MYLLLIFGYLLLLLRAIYLEGRMAEAKTSIGLNRDTSTTEFIEHLKQAYRSTTDD